MLEIAGGILIAVAILVALPYILAGAYWVVVIGVGLAIVIGGWFLLAAVVGEGWAWGISIAALVIWLGWSGSQEADEDSSETNSGKFSNGFGRKGG
jgi:membrane protein implicated in regulation of membrane protease activity